MSFCAVPRDIEKYSWVGSRAASLTGRKEDNQDRDIHDDLKFYAERYIILLERRRCGKSPRVKANRGRLTH